MATSYLPCLSSKCFDRDALITSYFGQGFSNLEILGFLAAQHDVFMSLSTLKRTLSKLGLYRRHPAKIEDREEIKKLVSMELLGSGNSMGYRKVWNVIKNLGIPAKRATIMEIMRELDPEGVSTRRKRRLRRRVYTVPGPDHLWHIDGYDKLKPFGFSVHGCIDGFSRRIIWLEVGVTNKQPEVIAHYYIQAVKQMNAVPLRIRSDDGTENSIVEAIQIALRSAHDDEFQGLASYLIGASTANQRIESLWSQFRYDRIIWWRNFFKELVDFGLLGSGNPVITECVRYSFIHLIRKDLKEFAERWNKHILAPSSNKILPRGRPDTLYFVPEIFNSQSFRKEVDLAEVDEFDDPQFCVSLQDNSAEFLEFAKIVFEMNNGRSNRRLEKITEAFEVYISLLEAVNKYM
ncbi:uncharacterized protein LOC130641714 [Hydractinia symbiolongicarpus]|uniref:uncharacterized protein LOC130641714 n=1 Tax=Hydractinia symbiolongicarpus TaxID=13093 RepID=UPI00254D894B|nr:uncharacterized protein LOC130641714 [Hydractinia symbiolongicarpus]